MDNQWTEMLREWNGREPIHIFLIILMAFVLYEAVRLVIPRLVVQVRPGQRFHALPWVPLLRLVIITGAASLIVPLIIAPTQENILALVGTLVLAVSFALKDYISCVFAGLLFLFERPYRVGDWVEISGTYGEVTELGLRAVKLVTADDNAITIPHSTLWTAQLSNATGGQPDLLCIAEFFVDPDHGKTQVRQELMKVASSSPYINPDRPVTVVMFQRPYGLYYKLKAYPKDAREQFTFITDLTERGLFSLRELGLKPIVAPVSVTK